MRRGQQVLHVSKLRKVTAFHKYAFVEIKRRDVAKVKITVYPLGIRHYLFLKGGHMARSKRSEQGGGSCKTGEASCCLSRRAVNLTDLGWDHVISPSVIQYTFCQGHCNPATLPVGLFLPQIARIRYVSTLPTKNDQPHQLSSSRSYTVVASTPYQHPAALLVT